MGKRSGNHNIQIFYSCVELTQKLGTPFGVGIRIHGQHFFLFSQRISREQSRPVDIRRADKNDPGIRGKFPNTFEQIECPNYIGLEGFFPPAPRIPDIGDSGKMKYPIRLNFPNASEDIFLRFYIQIKNLVFGRNLGNIRISRSPYAMFRRF